MKRIRYFMGGAKLIATAILVGARAANAQTTVASTRAPQNTPSWDTFSDTWIATDALGRTTPTNAQVGAPRRGKYVGIFYLMWLGQHEQSGPYNNAEITAKHPNAIQDANHPAWGPPMAFHHWGRPVFDFYLSTDEWVMRRHAQMLSDAGVDVVLLDNTNKATYRNVYAALCRVWTQIRREGGRTPQVAFLPPFWEGGEAMQTVFNEFYKPGEYSHLWFRWDGKPLIMGDPGQIGVTYLLSEHDTPTEVLTGRTLGQSFRAEKPFVAVAPRMPTYFTKNSDVTISLKRGGPRGETVRQTRVRNHQDSSWSPFEWQEPLPAGDYYVELSQPSGGRIGWWSKQSGGYDGGQAFADGVPVEGDRTLGVIYENPARREMMNFFTFRKTQGEVVGRDRNPRGWGWLDDYPQPVFRAPDGKPEQITVGVAQNTAGGFLTHMTNPKSQGRSFHNGKMPPPAQRNGSGQNFQEQWNRALREDPAFVFVDGWNEWVASRFDAQGIFPEDPAPVKFPDQFDPEFSRDVEPMQGGLGDNFYNQFVSNIRRYKGARMVPLASAPKTIRVEDGFWQWRGVAPEYRDDRFDTTHRNEKGWGSVGQLVNKTGRNDIVRSKVARDTQNVCFYVQTRERLKLPLAASTRDWMTLWINTDSSAKTGFLGFDFCIAFDKRSMPYARERWQAALRLDAWKNGAWKTIGFVPYRANGSEMMVSIPRRLLKLGARDFQIDFKWTDNVNMESDALNLYRNGDTAPNARFRYRYTTQRKPTRAALAKPALP